MLCLLKGRLRLVGTVLLIGNQNVTNCALFTEIKTAMSQLGAGRVDSYR